MSHLTRRQALAQLTASAAGLALAPRLLASPDPQPAAPRIGAFDAWLGHRQNVAALTVAHELGLDGVQVSFDDKGAPFDLRTEEAREQYLAESKRLNVAITSLAMGILNDVPYATDDRAQQWVRDAISIMPLMNQSIILLAFFVDGDIKDKPDLQDKVIARLKQDAPLAEKAGVTLGLETWLNVDEHRRIIEAVDSPAVKVYYDVANMHQRGYDVPREIRQLGSDLICQFHMKEHGVLLGQGPINFPAIRDAIRDIDYQGWLVLEAAVPPNQTARQAYPQNAAYLRQLFTE